MHPCSGRAFAPGLGREDGSPVDRTTLIHVAIRLDGGCFGRPASYPHLPKSKGIRL